MKMHEVQSSQISSLGWEDGELRIKFKSSGSVYGYKNVTEPQFKKLLNAKSIGSEFAATIKNNPAKYPFKKLGENGATVQSTECVASMELATVEALSLTGDGWEVMVSPEALKLKSELLAQSKKITKVNSDQMVLAARVPLILTAKFRGDLEKTRKMVKQKFLDGGREVDAIAEKFGKEVLAEENRISGLVSDYAREQEMKRRAAEMEAKRLIEESERKEREAEEARIAQEMAEQERFQALEDGKKKAAEASRLEALKKQREAEAAEKAEEDARKAAMQASIAAMQAPTAGTKMQLDYTITSIEKLYEAMPSLVTLAIKRRECLEFLNLQKERGLPVGLPGLEVTEVVKVSSR